MDSIGAPGSPMLAATSSLPMQSPSSTTPVEAESSRMGLKRQFIQTSMADEANSTTNEHVSDRQHHETATWYGHKRRQAASPQPYRMRHSNAMKAPRHLQCMSPTSVSATTTTPVSPTTATARPVLTRPIARPLKRRCTEPIVPCHRRSNSLPDSFRYAINFKYPTDPHLTRAHIVELHANALSVDPISIHVPGLKPPVSKTSLAELDSREILQNRQLRIDIVFDEKLCFRPNLDGERGKRKRLENDRFWHSVAREVSAGCRCTCFGVDDVIAPCICPVFGSRLPSRLNTVLNELLILLLSLLPAPASRARIIEVLSPGRPWDARAVQQASEIVGEILLQHCAPMRDPLVKQMMGLACRGPTESAHAIRMAFEIGELMKLDIANHTLRRLRPYLVMTAVPFAKRVYENVPAQSLTASFPKTVDCFKVKPTEEQVLRVVLDTMVEVEAPFFEPSLRKIPETLHQDLLRLGDFGAIFGDLILQYIVLLLASQFDTDFATMEQLKREVPIIAGFTPLQRTAGIPQAATRTGIGRFNSATWRAECIPSLGAQIALRTGQDPELVTSFLDSNTKLNSFFFSLVRRRLVKSIKMATLRHLSQEGARGASGHCWWTPSVPQPISPIIGESTDECRRTFEPIASLKSIVQPPAASTRLQSLPGPPAKQEFDFLSKNALLPFAGDIDILGERIARMVTFHWACYSDLYDRMF